jgi:hypothetical protein
MWDGRKPGRSAMRRDRVVRCWVFRARFWRAEPLRAVRCCTCFFYGIRGVATGSESIFRDSVVRNAILHLAVFSINIERGGFIVWRCDVIACCG